jgi:hypothetical protein
MGTDLEVSGIDGYGRDFLNRRRSQRRERDEGGKSADETKTDGKKPAAKPPKRPEAPGDTLVDFLA